MARIAGSVGGGAAEPETCFDGRVYNRRELGDEPADAALVERLARERGLPDALRALNGDFALAVRDPGGALGLARDRFGVKPLYYARTEDGWAFASQPGPLLELPGVDARPDPNWVARYAGSHYRTIDDDPGASPYRGVAQVPPASVVRLRAGEEPRIEPYWRLGFEPDETAREPELAERYRELLADAVAIRVDAFERPAFTLSGGMDSSSVVGFAAQLAGGGRVAFSTVYDDETYDESADIAPMLGGPVADWRPVRVGTPDVFALVEELVAIHDEPVATATWLSHHLLAREVAAAGFSALLGGLGGDELNAGEYEYFPFHFADLRSTGREEELRREIASWAHHHDHPVFRKDAAVAEASIARLADLSRPGRVLPDRTRMLRYAATLTPEYRAELERFEPSLPSPSSSYLKNRAWQDLSRETLPCCLRAEDRQTTAAGIEHALPFLDHRLVELMFRVPGDLKIRDGVTKRLLREATRGVIPEETRSRVKKTGWNAPAHVWFSGRDREPLLDLVRSRSFRERGIYDVAEVERLVDEHEAIVASGRPEENHMMFLWQLVNLELWLRRLDG